MRLFWQWSAAYAASLALMVFFPRALSVHLLLWSVVGAALWYLARRTLSRPTSAIVVASLFYFVFWLYYRPNTIYTNDLPYHLQYMQLLLEDPLRPYRFSGFASWHPPFYYWICAGLIYLFDGLQHFDPLTAVRLFSLVCYMAFIIYGLRTLKYASGREDGLYYIGCLLVVFWPVSMNMATRINNDIALYPLWAAMFYYLLRWWHEGDARLLQRSLVCTGLAFLVKSNALIPLAVWLAAVGYALGTRKLTWRNLWQPGMGRAIIWFSLCMAGNMGKWIYIRATQGWGTRYAHLGEVAAGGRRPRWSDFSSFDIDYYLSHPFTQAQPQPDVYNYFFKTLAFGEYPWRHIWLASGINTVMLCFFCLLALGCVWVMLYQRQERAALVLPLIGVLLPLAAILGYYLTKHMDVNLDARYILPFIVPLAILFVYSMRMMEKYAYLSPLYWLLGIAGAMLPVLAMVFYTGQHWLL